MEGNMDFSNIFAKPLTERSSQPAHIAGLYAPDDYANDEVRERVPFRTYSALGFWVGAVVA